MEKTSCRGKKENGRVMCKIDKGIAPAIFGSNMELQTIEERAKL